MLESKQYTKSFYKGHEKGSYDSAKAVLPIVQKHFNPQSVIDVGCGIGLWLKVWQDELGVNDIKGVEGDYINKQDINISHDLVDTHDLKLPYKNPKKYDLAMTLEVAEHLPKESADQFVETLTKLSDVVLFSAALIGQEGTYHINEQMPEYWAERFKKFGYVPLDLIRPLVWDKPEVMYWYKQNILIFIKEDQLKTLSDELKSVQENTFSNSLLKIHPDHYFRVLNRKKFFPFAHYQAYRIKKFFKEKL